MEIIEFMIIFLGGSIGAGLRYFICSLATVYSYTFCGTLLVNILGCLVFGFLMALDTDKNFDMSKNLKLFITTGIVSSFTTFSTFTYDILLMLQHKQLKICLIYLFLSFFLGTLCILFGYFTEKFFIDKLISVKIIEDKEKC